METPNPKKTASRRNFLSTSELGKIVGNGPTAVARWCADHPGFAIPCGGAHKIPRQHAQRLLSGEPISQIAATPSHLDLDELLDAARADEPGARHLPATID